MDWLTRSQQDQQGYDRIAELVSSIKAEATVDAHMQYLNLQAVWIQRVQREKKRLSSLSRSSTHVPLPTAPKSSPTAGMDESYEVPAPDARPWCSACALVKAYLQDDEQRVQDAELLAEDELDQAKRIYSVNPMSHDPQHMPMPTDSFNQASSHQKHMYQIPLGMQTYSMDALTNARWDLATHTGFHTWPHHDGSGMSTWVHARFGCKVWCPLIPKLPDSANLTQDDLFDAIRVNLQTAPCTDFHTHSQSLCLFLLPHDVLLVLYCYSP